MAAYGGLSSLMDTPLPPKSGRTLIEYLSSRNQVKHRTESTDASGHLTEIFGELNFEETPNSAAAEKKGIGNGGIEPSLDLTKNRFTGAKNLDSLQLCTEGLGSESSDDLDDLVEFGGDWSSNFKEKPVNYSRRPSSCNNCTHGKSSRRIRNFPPPISSIGKSGRPWICFRSYRHDGRFVLKEVRIPTQEYLRSSREGGRLMLHFVHPEESISEEADKGDKEGVICSPTLVVCRRINAGQINNPNL